ncbi:MAG: DNA-processing protein DprA [Candidatus Saccharimonadales bacterium]
MKINQILPQSNSYIQIINSIAVAPKTLYYIGTLPTQRVPSIAIVGTRKPTTYGKEVTATLASDLARRGVIIISGMAFGVDGIAHRAALDAHGITIAVQANGLDRLYPSSHRQLGEDIVAGGGAILSEYEPGTPGYPNQFLERNRIISGLSDAILITEAAAKSGTLNTASHALEQGKDVFVVPGNITSPLSAGCNLLLKQGAIPVTKTEDILERIAPHLLEPQTTLALGDNLTQVKIIELLQQGIRDGDELQLRSETNASEFATELTMMEINGLVRSLGANQWTLR